MSLLAGGMTCTDYGCGMVSHQPEAVRMSTKERHAEVARLWRRGYSDTEIATDTGYALVTVLKIRHRYGLRKENRGE